MKSKTNFFTTILAIIISLSFLLEHSEAATIKSVKGKTVFILLEGSTLNSGDLFNVLDSTGSKRGKIKVLKVTGNSAKGNLMSGSAEPGNELVFLRSNSNTSSVKKLRVGALAGVSLDSMTVKFSSSSQVAQSGTGFSALALADYLFTPSLGVRSGIGLEMFKATGTSPTALCGGSTVCSTSLTYISILALGRWIILTGSYRPWLGGGMNILYPASNSTNVLKKSKIGLATAFTVGGGVDIHLGGKYYFPIQIDYNTPPGSEDVAFHFIAVRAGIILPF